MSGTAWHGAVRRRRAQDGMARAQAGRHEHKRGTVGTQERYSSRPSTANGVEMSVRFCPRRPLSSQWARKRRQGVRTEQRTTAEHPKPHGRTERQAPPPPRPRPSVTARPTRRPGNTDRAAATVISTAGLEAELRGRSLNTKASTQKPQAVGCVGSDHDAPVGGDVRRKSRYPRKFRSPSEVGVLRVWEFEKC